MWVNGPRSKSMQYKAKGIIIALIMLPLTSTYIPLLIKMINSWHVHIGGVS